MNQGTATLYVRTRRMWLLRLLVLCAVLPPRLARRFAAAAGRLVRVETSADGVTWNRIDVHIQYGGDDDDDDDGGGGSGGRPAMWRRLLYWLVWNVPLGPLAPHVLGWALGTRPLMRAFYRREGRR